MDWSDFRVRCDMVLDSLLDPEGTVRQLATENYTETPRGNDPVGVKDTSPISSLRLQRSV